jgi:hypothetical protein
MPVVSIFFPLILLVLGLFAGLFALWLVVMIVRSVKGERSRGQEDTEEFNAVMHSLEKMEQRIENLEIILLDRQKK